MTKPMTIRVENNGVPVAGAEVIAGEVMERSFTTDTEGNLTKNVEDNFCIITPIAIRVGGTVRAISGPKLLEGDGTYVIDIGFSAPS